MRSTEEREAVNRLYHRLADALRRSRVEPFTSPVTVAEIYQELVPYRQVREELGFGMNADYEHALLCLLAGDGGHVRMEPDTARDAIVRELKTPNPNVSIYREYAGCDAWVAEPATAQPAASEDDDSALDWLEDLDEEELGTAVSTFAFLEQEAADDEDVGTGGGVENGVGQAQAEPWLGSGDSGPSQDLPAEAGEGEAAEAETRTDIDAEMDALVEDAWRDDPAPDPWGQALEAPSAAEARPAAEAQPARQGTAAEQDEAGQHCPFCDSDLPGGRVVRFCPFCGSDQSKRPCGNCDEVLEAGWAYCIACGSAGAGG